MASFRKDLADTKKGVAVAPDSDAPPWLKTLHAEIEGAPDASNRAISIANGMKKAIADCPPLAKAFGAAAALGVDEKEAALRESLPAAVEACDCEGVDVSALSYLVRFAMAAP